ncbi:MAG: PEP-CTERM sorting domain-containing protein [Planctomycetota bacterium]
MPGDDGNGSNSIPEPATLFLLGLGTFSLFKTRKN